MSVRHIFHRPSRFVLRAGSGVRVPPGRSIHVGSTSHYDLGVGVARDWGGGGLAFHSKTPNFRRNRTAWVPYAFRGPSRVPTSTRPQKPNIRTFRPRRPEESEWHGTSDKTAQDPEPEVVKPKKRSRP